MVTAGDKPGTGFYFCVLCGHRVYLEIGTDRLPPCTKCHGTEYCNGQVKSDTGIESWSAFCSKVFGDKYPKVECNRI